jgi:hypothetical protein
MEKLRKVNDFINRHIEFDEDLSIYHQGDYWATPLESIGQGRGDCEDLAIIKYFSLKDSGIALSKLRLVYVKARLNDPDGPRLQAHMVLAYYATPNAEPLVLDNLVSGNPAGIPAQGSAPDFQLQQRGRLERGRRQLGEGQGRHWPTVALAGSAAPGPQGRIRLTMSRQDK